MCISLQRRIGKHCSKLLHKAWKTPFDNSINVYVMPCIGLITQDSMILIISRVPCPSRDNLGHLSAPDQHAKTFLEANCPVAQAVSFVQFPIRKSLFIKRLTWFALFFPWTAYLNSTDIFKATRLTKLS